MYPVICPLNYTHCCPIFPGNCYGFTRCSPDAPVKNNCGPEEFQMCHMRGKKQKSKVNITDPITLGALKFINCYSPSVYSVLMNCGFIFEDAEKIVKKSLDEYFKDSGKKKKKQKDMYYYFYKYFYF